MLKIAHRGASAYAPENTLSAFRLAFELGADGVELDVHASADGEVVVIHDNKVNRTTNGRGLVSTHTLAQLRKLRIGGDEHIPTLGEVLRSLPHGAYCFIEIKHALAAEPAARLVQALERKGWPAGRLWLISFNHTALSRARMGYPALHIGASFEKPGRDFITSAAIIGARAVLLKWKYCTPVRIAAAQKAGLKIIAWTVNHRKSVVRLKDAGIDGIIGDYPEKLG